MSRTMGERSPKMGPSYRASTSSISSIPRGIGIRFQPPKANRRPAARKLRPAPVCDYLCGTKPHSIPRDEAVEGLKRPCLTAVRNFLDFQPILA